MRCHLTILRCFQALTALAVVLGSANGQTEKRPDYEVSSTFSVVTDPFSQNPIYVNVNRYSSKAGLPSFFLKSSENTLPISSSSSSAAGQVYLESFVDLIEVTGTQRDFVLDREIIGDKGSHHVSYIQHKNGIPVYGAEIRVHFDGAGRLTSINGNGSSLNPTAKTSVVDISSAIESGTREVKAHVRAFHFNDIQRKMLNYDGPKGTLQYIQINEKLELCWIIEYRPNFADLFEIIVSAESGQVLKYSSLVCHAHGPRKSYQSNSLDGSVPELDIYRVDGQNSSGFYKDFHLIDASRSMFNAAGSNIPNYAEGAVITYNGLGAVNGNFEELDLFTHRDNNVFGENTIERSAVSAQLNAKIFMDEVSERFGFPDFGFSNDGNLKMIVNVNGFGGSQCYGLDNAYWNGEFAVFGNDGYNPSKASECKSQRGIYNDQAVFKSATSKGLDIVSHELTHGLVENDGPRLLKSSSPQTAALNEAIADIMACIVDGNFTIGENSDINELARPSGLLRNIKNPHSGQRGTNNLQADYANGYSANHYDEFVGKQDAAHYNSTIISHAFYLMSGNGQLNRMTNLFYKVVTERLTRSAKFSDFVKAFIEVANEEEGYNSYPVKKIKEAFEQVGLGIEDPIDFNNLPGLEGDNYLFCERKSEWAHRLFLFKYDEPSPDVAHFESVNGFNSSIELVGNASVTDDGEYIYGVNTEGQIVRVSRLDDELEPMVLSIEDGRSFDQVAVSKNNNRLAYTHFDEDPAIIILNEEDNRRMTYPLNIVTRVKHNNTEYNASPVKIGAMEWDYYGTKIIFEFASTFITRKNLVDTVWNIAEIEVWNDEDNTFKEGKISPLFKTMNSFNDLRNPSFAKNNTEIFVYDFYDHNKKINEVTVWDRTGENAMMNLVLTTKILAHPTYTNTDGALIVTDISETGDPSLFYVALEPDKITRTPDSNLVEILSEHKNPLWFTVGSRSSISDTPEPPDQPNEIFGAYPNPFQTEFRVQFGEEPGILKIYDLRGQVVLQKRISSGEPINTDILPSGQYVLQVTTEIGQSVTVITKE